MASGKQHNKGIYIAFAVSSGISVPLAIANPFNIPYLISFNIGILSGVVFNPDLDFAHRAFSFKNPKRVEPVKRWGPLAIIWAPYGFFIPHRSFLSHGPIISTLIRVGYFIGCLWLASHLRWVGDFIDFPWILDSLDDPRFIFWLIGLAGADIIHLLMDGGKTTNHGKPGFLK